jgi:hypothetical protein
VLEIVTKLHFDLKNLTTKQEKQSSWKVIAICLVDGDIDKYYSWFLFKRFNLELNRPIRKAHITVINDRLEDREKYNQAKQVFEGKEIKFQFDPADIRSSGKHWWINVQNTDVEAIREFAGLSRKPNFKLHLTLGYANEKNIAHSQYILEQILRFNL